MLVLSHTVISVLFVSIFRGCLASGPSYRSNCPGKSQQKISVDMTIVCCVSHGSTSYVSFIFQAFQTRLIRKEINESQTLAIMIYSHFVFVLLLLITLFLSGTIDDKDLMLVTSLIFSLDVIVTITVYFIPKFLAAKESRHQSDIFVESSTVKHLQMLAAIATSQHELRLSNHDPNYADHAGQSSSRQDRPFGESSSDALSLISDPTAKKEVQRLGTTISSSPQKQHLSNSVTSEENLTSTLPVMPEVDEPESPDTQGRWCHSCDEKYCCPNCGESARFLRQDDSSEKRNH